MRTTLAAGFALFLAASGCGSRPNGNHGGGAPDGGDAPDGGSPGDGYFAPSALQVSGRILDFESGKPLTGPATMATAALLPSPDVSISGSNFTLSNVPPFCVFFLIAGSPPDHRLTYNAPTTVKDQPVTNVDAFVVADAYLTKLRAAFGLAAQSGTSTVLVHVVDGNGAAQAGVPGSALALNVAGARGPYFVDASLQPLANATATSASGWMIYFDVAPGTFKLAAGAGYSVQTAATPATADAVSLVRAALTQGAAPPPPSNVSFQQSVLPIFMTRGCYNCHSGNGAGRRLGGLVLDGASQKIWSALVQAISPNFGITRVNLQAPDKSLVLTMPSYANPPNGHPTVVFPSSSDPDFQKILTWIKEGALYN